MKKNKTRNIKSGVSAAHILPEPNAAKFIVQWQNHGSSLTLTRSFDTLGEAQEFRLALRPKT